MELVLGRRLLGRRAQEAGRLLDIRRIRKDEVERPPGLVGPEVRFDDLDPALQPVERDVAPGQVGQPRLDLERRDAPEGLDAEEQRDDAAPGPDLEDLVPFPRPDEIR
ncbi:MAG: hypothetical protein MZV70_71025 [Desulfobacterales bacterium]|nr:hypothetical protein [Desulfobacterales bacterium]